MRPASSQMTGDAPKRTFAEALRTPVLAVAPSEMPASALEEAPVSVATVAGASPVDDAVKKKKPHHGKHGGVNSGNQAAKKRETAAAVRAALEINRAPTAASSADKSVTQVKKGGRVAAKQEAAAAAAADVAANGKPKAKKLKQKKSKPDELYGGDGEDAWDEVARVPFNYTHSKPTAITDALFMWETIAAYSEPSMALRLLSLCRDVAQQLRASHRANHLMQRYWNAQWARLVWDENQLTDEKRFLLPTSLTRSEGKIDWKKMYREELPLWQHRTFSGVGVNNNASNVAKVLFHQETLNEVKTAAELARSELTVKEALLKAQMKRGVDVKVDNETNSNVDGAAMRSGGGGFGSGAAGKGCAKLRIPAHDPSTGFTRAYYKQNYRHGARKGKHNKGGDKKWESYAALEDDGDFY